MAARLTYRAPTPTPSPLCLVTARTVAGKLCGCKVGGGGPTSVHACAAEVDPLRPAPGGGSRPDPTGRRGYGYAAVGRWLWLCPEAAGAPWWRWFYCSWDTWWGSSDLGRHGLVCGELRRRRRRLSSPATAPSLGGRLLVLSGVGVVFR
uniref:Uncharacterized protein n=1 Tax=Leersia perrieri TaxID=77586 RepID=A0A0D9X7U6_9ORYZ